MTVFWLTVVALIGFSGTFLALRYPVFHLPRGSRRVGTVRATEDAVADLHAMTDDPTGAMLAGWCQRLNCTFETIERVLFFAKKNIEALVVVVSTYFASSHKDSFRNDVDPMGAMAQILGASRLSGVGRILDGGREDRADSDIIKELYRNHLIDHIRGHPHHRHRCRASEQLIPEVDLSLRLPTSEQSATISRR